MPGDVGVRTFEESVERQRQHDDHTVHDPDVTDSRTVFKPPFPRQADKAEGRAGLGLDDARYGRSPTLRADRRTANTRHMRFVRAASVGVTAWFLAGAVVASLLVLLLGEWSNGFAISGLVLVLGSLGWVLGPFRTP